MGRVERSSSINTSNSFGSMRRIVKISIVMLLSYFRSAELMLLVYFEVTPSFETKKRGFVSHHCDFLKCDLTLVMILW